MNQTFATNEQIVLAARRNLAQGPWDYLVGARIGNDDAPQSRSLRPPRLSAARRHRCVEARPLDDFLGQPLRIPVMLAPIGSLQVFTTRRRGRSAQAAHRFGVMPVISSRRSRELEETAAAATAPRSTSSTSMATTTGSATSSTASWRPAT